jgi:predicted membrane channel-forming protein YqfA (hemolysin III family)
MDELVLILFGLFLLALTTLFSFFNEKRKTQLLSIDTKNSEKNFEKKGFFGYSSESLIFIPLFFLFFCHMIIMVPWFLDLNQLDLMASLIGASLFLISLLLCYIVFLVFTKFNLEE